MKKEHDHNEWGNIGNPEDFNKSNQQIHWTSKKRKKHAKTVSKQATRQWNDPEFRKNTIPKLRKGVERRNQDPEYFKKLHEAIANKDQTEASNRMKERHKDKEWQASLVTKALANRNTQEYKDKLAAGIAKRNANPDWGKKHGVAMRKVCITPFGRIESTLEVTRKHNVFFGSKRDQMPHLYYYEEDGPGKPTYENVYYTPYGVFQTVKLATIEEKKHQKDLPVTWFYIKKKKDPKNYYVKKEIRREWLLENKNK